MSGVNPVVLLQLINSYHFAPDSGARTFNFQKNNRMRVHNETEIETEKRKSFLSKETKIYAEKGLYELLKKSLKNRLGKVYVDNAMSKIAVPLEMATGASGFGVLPTGSRVAIPRGAYIRAFTYWEKVNDIDLSCFALTEDGQQEEFSWRNMYRKQANEITYSGDQTSGYNGGSEYFDFDYEYFKYHHPGYRYLVFCDNVFSTKKFKEVDCTAGVMIRQDGRSLKGELNPVYGPIFDPKTVETSFKITADATFAYLFAIDLETREMIWLNIARQDKVHVAGTTDMSWMMRYLKTGFTAYDLYQMCATEIVDDPEEADIVVSDSYDGTTETVHSYDFEKMLSLLQA